MARAKHGDPVNVALADSNIAEILADQGRLAEADELLADAVTTWSAADDPWGVAVGQRARGIIAARSARFADAEALLDAARATLERIGAKLDVAATDLAIADLCVRRADGPGALAALARAVGTTGAADHLGPALHRLRGIAWAQIGAAADAIAELDAALAMAREQGNQYETALVLDLVDQAGPELGIAASVDRRVEAAEILRRLDVISVPGYPISSGAEDGRPGPISGT
jgi:tetratricopeptide (TPR) repeat protein